MIQLYKSFIRTVTSMSLLNFIFLVRLVFGNYFDSRKSKLICVLLRLYCFCFAAFWCFPFFYNHFREGFSIPLTKPYFYSVLEYTINVVFSLICADCHIFKYWSAIKTTDKVMGFKNIPLFTHYSYVILVLSLINRTIACIFRATVYKPYELSYIRISIVLYTMDLNFIICANIFSILHNRLTLLRLFLENMYFPVNTVADDRIAISVQKIRKGLYNYNSLLDNILLIDRQLQNQLAVTIATTLPKLISIQYVCFMQFTQGNYILTITLFIEAVQMLFMLSSPAIVSELIMYELGRIKKVLAKQLVKCSDASLRLEIETTLQYVTLRPFSFTIWRVVPVNINLPFIIIGLALTYVIVVMQLIHSSSG